MSSPKYAVPAIIANPATPYKIRDNKLFVFSKEFSELFLFLSLFFLFFPDDISLIVTFVAFTTILPTVCNNSGAKLFAELYPKITAISFQKLLAYSDFLSTAQPEPLLKTSKPLFNNSN